MEICDAHFHFNMKSTDPIQDMLHIIHKYHLRAVVLILNQECEFEVLMKNWEQLLDCGVEIHLGVLMDIYNLESFYKKMEWLLAHKMKYSVKLHPRLSNIQKKDFQTIDMVLHDIEFEHIIIDAFYYGSRIENLIYDELAIYLAKKQKNKKIVMSHFGGVNILRTVLCTREVPNIFYDISFTINYFSKTSVWMDIFHCIRINPHRVMYGSDYPGFSEGQSLESIKNMFSQFGGSVELYENLLAENALRIYFGKETKANG